MSTSLIQTAQSVSGTILVVEDNEINRFLIKKFLKRWGLTGDFAENGQEAVDKVKTGRYDAVLMDIQMPVMNGLEATTAIRRMNNGNFRELPIIALTASILDRDVEEIMKSGMSDYISKPFSPDQLYSKLSAFLRK